MKLRPWKKLGAASSFMEHTLLIDRHIEKNGGTSARWLMHRAEEHGHCVCTSTEILSHLGMTSILRALTLMRAWVWTDWGYENLGDAVRLLHSHADRRWPPLCIEAHASVGHGSIRRLHDLCQRLHWRCVFWLRWRRPLSYYLSFFRWGTLPQLALRTPESAHAAFISWTRVHTKSVDGTPARAHNNQNQTPCY